MTIDVKLRRYILMSRESFAHADLKASNLMPNETHVTISARTVSTANPEMRVLESIGNDGPKLVEMSAEGELSLRLSMPKLKVVPEVFFYPQLYRPEVLLATPLARARIATTIAAADGGTTIKVIDLTSGNGLAGAHIVAFTNFASRTGASGDSGLDGVARLDGLSPTQGLDRLYIYGPDGYWGYYATATSVDTVQTIRLNRIDIEDSRLLLLQLYGTIAATAGAGTTVGVIDTGIDGQHPDLPNVSGGLNCVGDEVRADPTAIGNWGPAAVEGEHGTHVAGIVAGRGSANGFRGIAPAATLRSYRVFPNAGGGASNFDIAKAIDAATEDHCDLINMSLGGGPADDLTRAAIDRALAAGVVVVAAAGNDSRQPVSYPAAFPECVAVSAMGRRGSFPADAIGTSDIAIPNGGAGNADFVADFSNFGTAVDVTGPGVEIVSTVPGGAYASMSGTSMATPAVTGFAAYLLSINATIRQEQGANRSKGLKDLLYASCKPEGFGREFEGFGLPLPEPAETS